MNGDPKAWGYGKMGDKIGWYNQGSWKEWEICQSLSILVMEKPTRVPNSN